jgi:O-glycosyl hydrolase
MRRFDGTIYSGGMNTRELGLYRNYIDEFLGDREMRDILGNKISVHGYFSDAWSDRMGKLRELAWENVQEASPRAKIWMSEFCILGSAGDERSFGGHGFDVDDMDLALHVAKVIHRDLVRLNASAWHWWLALTPYDYKDGLLKIDPSLDPESVEASKVFWTLGNFSRFIRPGYRRVGNANADDLKGLMASAYKSPDDTRIVVVIVNASDAMVRVSLRIDNLPPSKCIAMFHAYTTNEKNALSPSIARNSLRIPARSTVTLVGKIGP